MPLIVSRQLRLMPIAVAIALVSGCTTTTTNLSLDDVPARPTSAWVVENYAVYKTTATEYPTAHNVARFLEVKDHMRKMAPAIERGERTSRPLTLTFSNAGDGGAAMRQPGYVHVVNSDFNQLRKKMQSLSNEAIAQRLVDEAGLSEVQAQQAITALQDMRLNDSGHARDWLTPDPQGYSMYEMSRWSRYCDGGRNMDEDDWRFVTQEGTRNAPSLFTYCETPAHDYYDYLRAWERFCESAGATRRDLSIVRDSVRPHSTVNDCKALNL